MSMGGRDEHELQAKLIAMRQEIAELEATGQGLADAHARATREIRLRQALELQRGELRAEVERLREELKGHDAARLAAERSSQENAEIANQVRARDV